MQKRKTIFVYLIPKSIISASEVNIFKNDGITAKHTIISTSPCSIFITMPIVAAVFAMRCLPAPR